MTDDDDEAMTWRSDICQRFDSIALHSTSAFVDP